MRNWNEIVRENASTVTNGAMRVLGSFADAEDVAQEVFVEAFHKWQADSGQQWKPLLKKMAVFRSLDHLRRRKPYARLGEHDDGGAADPADLISAREFEARLRSAIAELPKREAEVFCLVCFESLTNPEAAQLLGISSTAVATALSKARNKLQLNLGLAEIRDAK